MAQNTSIQLGEYFESFVKKQVQSGRYSSVSEVIRTALRLFEIEENKAKSIIKELEKGEQSKMVEDFDYKQNLKNLHEKYLNYEG